MSNFFEKAKSDVKNLEKELLGPDYNYVKFIRKSIAKKLLEWRTTYGDKMLNHIAEAVNKFAQTTIFSL